MKGAWGSLNGLLANREVASPSAGRPQPVSLVRWRAPRGEASPIRVTLHPLRNASGSVVPTPPGAVYSSETAGGFVQPFDFNALIAGQPTAAPCYALVRWGVGAYQTSVIADWPRNGGGFDVAADNLEIDGLLTATGGPPVQFGAHTCKGDRVAPESVGLTFSQEIVLTGVAWGVTVPGYASKIRIQTSQSTALAMSWFDITGNLLGVVSCNTNNPQYVAVPAGAVVLTGNGNGAQLGLVWSLAL